MLIFTRFCKFRREIHAKKEKCGKKKPTKCNNKRGVKSSPARVFKNKLWQEVLPIGDLLASLARL